jgi:hypothetical protein
VATASHEFTGARHHRADFVPALSSTTWLGILTVAIARLEVVRTFTKTILVVTQAAARANCFFLGTNNRYQQVCIKSAVSKFCCRSQITAEILDTNPSVGVFGVWSHDSGIRMDIIGLANSSHELISFAVYFLGHTQVPRPGVNLEGWEVTKIEDEFD